MEIAEVQDKESLERYLNWLPEDERARLSWRLTGRAAFRVLPIAILEYAQNLDRRPAGQTVLPVFGSFIAPSRHGLGASPNPVEAAIEFVLTNTEDDSANSAIECATVAIRNVPPSALAFVTAYAVDKAAVALGPCGAAIWASVRSDFGKSKIVIWPDGMPENLAADWQTAKDLLAQDDRADWSFWIAWYDRVLAGRDTLPDELAPILSRLTQEDWKKGPAHINPMFDDVLAMYRADDAASAGAESQDRPTNQVRAIQAQVSALQEFLDAEYHHLTGHNARSPEQDKILELLKELKALVADMISRLEEVTDNAGALIVVRENLPAIVERTGELAIIEEPPVVSPTIVTMSASIKLLVDSGADPVLATKIAMGEAARQKLLPKLKDWLGF